MMRDKQSDDVCCEQLAKWVDENQQELSRIMSDFSQALVAARADQLRKVQEEVNAVKERYAWLDSLESQLLCWC